jgi:glycosyltransferase involved in cell wall biosynthesis
MIVVDDGSTDAPPDGMKQVDEPRVRFVRLDEPRGVASARNAGIAAARGDWVAFLDDDDLWSPRKLREQIDAAESAGAVFAYGGVVSVDGHGEAQYEFPLPDPAELPTRLLVSSVLPAGCSNVVARTEVVRELGGFDEELFQLSDWDLWIRLANAGAAAACADVLVGYLEHDANMLLTATGDVTRELAYLERKHAALRDAHGVELDRRTFLHWVAWGHLRRGQRLRAARVFMRSGLDTHSARDLALAAAFTIRAAVPLTSTRRALHRVLKPRTAARPLALPGPAWLELYR